MLQGVRSQGRKKCFGIPIRPEALGGHGMSLAQVCREQCRLAYHAPATALAVNMHLYWTGLVADLWRAGDTSLEWLLREAAAGAVFAAGHAESGNDLPLPPRVSAAPPLQPLPSASLRRSPSAAGEPGRSAERAAAEAGWDAGSGGRGKRPFELSVQEMSSDPKWHGTKVCGCKGSSVRGRNLGTSARCSDVFPHQEDPHGRARCRDEYSGRRASAPGAYPVYDSTLAIQESTRCRPGNSEQAPSGN